MATAVFSLTADGAQNTFPGEQPHPTSLTQARPPSCSTPCAESSPPSLTPASEVDETDYECPQTPNTPSKIQTTSRILATSLALNLEHRRVKIDLDDALADSKISDVSSHDSSTKAWLFRESKDLETWTPPDSKSVSIDFDFDFSCSMVPLKQETNATTATSETTAGLVANLHTLHENIISDAPRSVSTVAISLTESTTLTALKSKLLRILPTDVISRLRANGTRCVAQTSSKTPRRCNQRQRVAGVNPELIANILDGRDAGTTKNIISALRDLRHLLPDVLCTSGKHRSTAMKELEAIESELAVTLATDISAIETVVGGWLHSLASDTPEPPCTVAVLGDKAAVKEHKTLDSTARPPLRRSKRVAGKTEPTVHVTYEPYYTSTSRKVSISAEDLIRAMLLRRLLQSETTDGYLYVFWRKGDFGLVKIGYTRHNPTVRLTQWQSQCGDDSQGCESTVDKSLQVKVRNVRRLENLVHAELKEYRRKQVGCRCGKTHKEWFQVDIRLVQVVVAKWTQWLRTRPRYLVGQLLALEKGELQRLCTPLELPASTKLKETTVQTRRSKRLKEKAAKLEPSLGDNPWATLKVMAVV